MITASVMKELKYNTFFSVNDTLILAAVYRFS